MPPKLKTASTLLNIYGWLFTIVGIIFGIFFFGIGLTGLFSNDSATAFGSIFVGGFVGFVILVFMVGIGIFHIITASAMKKQKSWTRVAGIVLGILMLGSFPLGTIFGIFILIGVFEKESENWLLNAAGTSTNHATKA